MASSSYDEILRRARQELSVEEQLTLINELCNPAATNKGLHHIRELRGLGKHVWEGVDPDEFVRKERDAWSG